MPEDKLTLEEQEVNPRATRSYWQKWIKAAKKAADDHFKDAKVCWDEFELKANQDRGGSDRVTSGTYPIYYSSVKTLEPAYYSRTPSLGASRRFGINDAVALTASTICERFAKYLVDSCDFDAVMQSAVADFIHADKTTIQVIYTADLIDAPTAPVMGPDMAQPPMGMLEGESEEGEDETEDETEVQTPKIATNKRVYLAPICYDEIIHTPDAKTWEEVKEVGYFFCLEKDEALAKFPMLAQTSIQWKQGKSYEEDKADSSDRPGQYLEGWECWCKKTKKLYFYSEQYAEGLLDVQDDPYQLRRFFPSAPFAIGSKPSKSLYPTPALIHMLDTARQLHASAAKVLSLTDAIKWGAIIDGADEDLELALNSLKNGQYLAAKNFKSMLEKGGIQNMMFFLPLKELVDAIVALNSLQDRFDQQFYQWFGVPDILRGASDPMETAAAQDIKATSAHDRFKCAKRQIAELARNGIEMMLDLGLQVFAPEEIANIIGLRYMSAEDQQRFPEALQFLKDDESRIVRIELDTDSMSFSDQQLRYQRASTALQAVTQGLDLISSMSERGLEFAAVGLQAVLGSLDTLQAGKQFTDGVAQAGQALLEKLKNPPEQPPPPPDYEAMKIQIAQQKVEMDGALKARDLSIKENQLSADNQKAAADLAMQQMKLDTEKEVQGLALQLEAQRVETEKFKARLQATESEMEEIRLAKEADTNQARAAIEAMKPDAAPVPAASPVEINIGV
jgi:hypothetical protein